MKLELDISLDSLEKLKSLETNINKYPFIVLSTEEEVVLKDLLFLIFDRVSEKEQYQKRLNENQDKMCKCGHNLSYHSPMADRLCTFIECSCFKFEEKKIAQA